MNTLDLINQYEEDRAAHITDEVRAGVIYSHLRAHFGRHKPTSITPRIVTAYTRCRQEGKIGRPSQMSTVRLELARLVTVFAHARKHRLITDVPHIDLPPTPEAKDRWLTWGEYQMVWMEADARTQLAMDIAIETAARPGFVQRLQWPAVDLQRGIINYQDGIKAQTKKKRVPVPISDRLKPVLEAAYADKGLGSYVLGRSTIWRNGFNRACQAACVEGATPHTLRHTKATWMAQQGISMWKIAGVLGDSLDTVVKRYAHHHPDHLRDAVEARSDEV